jgi:hypothetical protein
MMDAMTTLYWARLVFLAVLLLLAGALAALAMARDKRRGKK